MMMMMFVMKRMAKYAWHEYKTNEDILSEPKINPGIKKIKITETNGYNMYGEWTETGYTLNYEISATWEMKSRTTPQKTYR